MMVAFLLGLVAVFLLYVLRLMEKERNIKIARQKRYVERGINRLEQFLNDD